MYYRSTRIRNNYARPIALEACRVLVTILLTVCMVANLVGWSVLSHDGKLWTNGWSAHRHVTWHGGWPDSHGHMDGNRVPQNCEFFASFSKKVKRQRKIDLYSAPL